MHDANKGMGCFLGYMRKIGHLVLWKIWRVQMRDLSPWLASRIKFWRVDFNRYKPDWQVTLKNDFPHCLRCEFGTLFVAICIRYNIM